MPGSSTPATLGSTGSPEDGVHRPGEHLDSFERDARPGDLESGQRIQPQPCDPEPAVGVGYYSAWQCRLAGHADTLRYREPVRGMLSVGLAADLGIKDLEREQADRGTGDRSAFKIDQPAGDRHVASSQADRLIVQVVAQAETRGHRDDKVTVRRPSQTGPACRPPSA